MLLLNPWLSVGNCPRSINTCVCECGTKTPEQRLCAHALGIGRRPYRGVSLPCSSNHNLQLFVLRQDIFTCEWYTSFADFQLFPCKSMIGFWSNKWLNSTQIVTTISIFVVSFPVFWQGISVLMMLNFLPSWWILFSSELTVLKRDEGLFIFKYSFLCLWNQLILWHFWHKKYLEANFCSRARKEIY